MSFLSRHILLSAACCALISGLYYLSLAAGLPLFLPGLFSAALITAAVLWDRRAFPGEPTALPARSILILASGLALILWKGWQVTRAYGGWDAMAIWNYHARFLADRDHWQRLYLIASMDHPDYPLCLPAVIGAAWRILGTSSPLVPVVFSWWVLLLIPALVYSEVCRRSRLWAFVTLLLFCGNYYFIWNAVSQYADTLTGMYLLGALVGMHRFSDTGKSSCLLLCGGCLGGLLWTKNEGMLLASVFLLFHLRTFFRKGGWLAAGMLFPLAALLVHKLCFAPANDLVSHQDPRSLRLLFSADRAWLVLRSFWDFLYNQNRVLTLGLILYLMVSALRKRRIPADLAMIGMCMLGFMLVYLASPNNLEWHLATSMDRVIHQLVPVTIYVLALRFSGAPYPETGKNRLQPSAAYPGAFDLNRLT